MIHLPRRMGNTEIILKGWVYVIILVWSVIAIMDHTKMMYTIKKTFKEREREREHIWVTKSINLIYH